MISTLWYTKIYINNFLRIKEISTGTNTEATTPGTRFYVMKVDNSLVWWIQGDLCINNNNNNNITYTIYLPIVAWVLERLEHLYPSLESQRMNQKKPCGILDMIWGPPNQATAEIQQEMGKVGWDEAVATLQWDNPSLNDQENKVPVSKEDKRVLILYSRAATAGHQPPGTG